MGMKYRDPETGQFKDISVKVSDTLPIGTQVAYGGSTPPTGWLICDGSAVSRTEYADLFKVIGTSYGTGDGSTTFNLPNKKGRVSAGYDSSTPAYNSIGKHTGSNTHFHLLPIGSFQNQDNVAINGNSGNYEDTTISAGYVRKSEATYSSITTPTNIRKSYSDVGSSIQPTEVDQWIIKAFQSIGVVGKVAKVKTDSDNDAYSCNYVNEILTTKAGTVQKGAEIDNEHTNIALKKNGNVVTVQGVVYFTNSKTSWTTFMTIPTDYNGVTGYGNLIEETTGKTYPVIVQDNGQVQCSVAITSTNAYYYINIVYLI